MLTQLLLFIYALVFLYLSYRYAVARPVGFPPGPPRIPFFGSYLFMLLTNYTYLHKAVLKFSKWYNSDIVGFHVGNFPVVAVHNEAGIREVLDNSDFDGRPQIFVADLRSPGDGVKGIFFIDGEIWKEQRRFVLRYLRDFGFGRRHEKFELVINEDIMDMLHLIRNGPKYEHEYKIVKPKGYRILLPIALNLTVCNSYFHLLLNERFERSEQASVLELVRQTMIFARRADDYGNMLSILPWIRHIFPGWSSYRKMKTAADLAYAFFQKMVDHQMETYDESSERNFMDVYIREMLEARAKGEEQARGFTVDQFIMGLSDFAFPSMTAVGSQLSLLIQYLLLHPEVLNRIQKEIDDVVGRGRLPSLEDRQYMHFTEATIREGLRIETLVPSDIPHKALVDTTLLGYSIPKNTIIFPSLYAYHIDKRVWHDPENFRPERFLNAEGKLCLKQDVSLPFGAGKRLCAGETFARNMLFLVTTALCQNFNLILAPGDKIPNPSLNLSGITISPADFWLQLEERQ